MAWWQQLIPRERLALVLAAISILLLLVYQLIWQPLQQDLQRAESQRVRLQADYLWMQQASQQIKAYGAQPRSSQNKSPRRSLLVEVDDSLKRAGMGSALEEIKPDGNKLLRVFLKNVDFDQVIAWLGYLKKQDVHVTSSVIDRLQQTSKADIRLTFERKEGSP